MNAVRSRQSTFDGHHHHQPTTTWTPMPPPYAGFGAGGPVMGHAYPSLPYERPQQQVPAPYPQQQQQQPQMGYAPPHAPHLPNRHYQPLYYPIYAAPYSVHPSPAMSFGTSYYPQQQQGRPSFPPAPAPYPLAQSSYGYESSGVLPPPPYRQNPQLEGGSRSRSRGRWIARSSFDGDRSLSNDQQGIWRDGGASREASAGPRRVSEGSTGQSEFDYAPFDRTPYHSSSQGDGLAALRQHHHAVAPPHVLHQQPVQAPTPQLIKSTATTAPTDVEYDLVSNVSVVPAPPSLEMSAVCLSDLATEMVWEACLLALDSNGHRAPSSPNAASRLHRISAKASLRTSDESRRSSNVPELFGAIGEGRQRKASADESASDYSSPSSSAPGTPAGVRAMEAAANRKQRLVGCGLGFGFPQDVKSSNVEVVVDARTVKNNGAGATSFPAEPSPAFRQFVKQVLTATLLAPEDLILALYYIAKIPSASMIPPPSADQLHGASARASVVKAAPFKLILGALMLANKTLQDNSYRNETFAAVSGIPLKDVNDLEVFVFAALAFDVTIPATLWKNWVGVVIERVSSKRGGDLGSHLDVSNALGRLLDAAAETPSSAPVFSSPNTSTPSSPTFIDHEFEEESESPLRADQGGWSERFEFSDPKSLKGFPTSDSRRVV